MPATAPSFESLIDRAFDIIPEIFPEDFYGATEWLPADRRDLEENLAIIFLATHRKDSEVGRYQFQILTNFLAEYRIPVVAQRIRGRLYVAIADSQQIVAFKNLAGACIAIGILIMAALRDKSQIDGQFLLEIVNTWARLKKQPGRNRK